MCENFHTKKIWYSINIHTNRKQHSVCAFDSPENGNVEKQMQRKTNRNYGKRETEKTNIPEFATCTRSSEMEKNTFRKKCLLTIAY